MNSDTASNTHTRLHAVADVGAHRVRTLPEHPGRLVAGAGAPIVLLHSSLSSKAQWGALAARLTPRFRVIALDLCGYGDNALPSAPASFTLDDEVRLVEDHVDRLVPPHVRVHVVGHSYGGLVALRFAQRSRGRVASLTMYEPVAFGILDTDDAALKEVKQLAACLPGLIAAGLRLQAAQLFVDFWSGPGTYGCLARPAQVAVARNVGKVPLDFQAAMSWPTDSSSVRSIATPALLLSGNHSPAIARAIVQRLTSSLPKRYVGRIDAGHMGPVTAPDLVNPWIEAFIDMCAELDAATAGSALDAMAPFPSAAD
jgi:pimeloyl-ACP methyl ester carboxylesterase